MGKFGKDDYKIINDGWIKIEASDFQVGLPKVDSRRVLIGLNQFLVYLAGTYILIDTGLGDKWSPAELDLLDYEKPRRLLGELEKEGVKSSDIGIVILTHMHYDHSGGGTCIRSDGSLAPVFTNSVYYVQGRELKHAQSAVNADYKPADFEPLLKTGRIVTVDGDADILPGLSVHPAPGHSPGHQVVLIKLTGKTLLFAGDLFATSAMLNLHTTMIYDEDREEVIRQRRKWLDAAKSKDWDVVLCHAIRNPVQRFVMHDHT
jgi:glyoxylase-like metal-dependent hydrolase (beta-lactamase superfamily II)